MLRSTIAVHVDAPSMSDEVEMHVHPSVAAVPAVKASVNATGSCDEGAARNRSMGCMSASVLGVAFSCSIER